MDSAVLLALPPTQAGMCRVWCHVISDAIEWLLLLLVLLLLFGILYRATDNAVLVAPLRTQVGLEAY
jgi:hypothetical protein